MTSTTPSAPASSVSASLFGISTWIHNGLLKPQCNTAIPNFWILHHHCLQLESMLLSHTIQYAGHSCRLSWSRPSTCAFSLPSLPPTPHPCHLHLSPGSLQPYPVSTLAPTALPPPRPFRRKPDAVTSVLETLRGLLSQSRSPSAHSGQPGPCSLLLRCLLPVAPSSGPHVLSVPCQRITQTPHTSALTHRLWMAGACLLLYPRRWY